ncbi:DEAD/DEAH box helicase [Halosegnis sp.]|uniref:DEAD/DEAH box helicase n=1 Tax=Halosegnis sp. TaxID=2864959 RepID=UPI0035D4EBE9
MTDAHGLDAFAHLAEPVRAALSERGFDRPTEPQRRAIPPLAAGRNGLVVAPTGTGKTETAMLPVLSAVAERDQIHGVQALYVTPLRALNRDMRERLDWWGDQLDVTVDVRHGDTTDYQRSKQADNPPDVLVTTPETLQAMFTGEKLRRALEDVGHVIVDEVHELAASKRGTQLAVGLEHLREYAGAFQRIGLSATVGDPAEVGRFLTGGRDCEVIEVDAADDFDVEVVQPEITSDDEILASELVTDAAVASHVRFIDELITTHDSTLVFVNTRTTAEGLGSRLKEYGTDIAVHHGSLSKEARVDVEERLKNGDIDALVCTSSMELGIDVGVIDHVVQYHSPREVARLLQRVGRAGHRSGRTSTGTVVTTRPDDTFEALAIASMAKEGVVESADIHHGSLDTIANQIAGILMGFGEVSARGCYEILSRAYPYRDLEEETFKEVVRELSDNHVLWLNEEADRLEKSRGTWEYFYRNLSMIPDEQNFRVVDMASGRTVGTLAERFVVNFAAPGEVFVQGGEMWRITTVDEDDEEVQVTPVEDPGGEVPSWTGQEIPVPYEVAQRVGRMRARARKAFEDGRDRQAVAREFAAEYPTDESTASEALSQIKAHEAPMPSDDTLLVEGYGREVVINAAFGHTTNETLGRLLSALIGQQTGSSVGLETDPYRVELEVPSGIYIGDVVDLLYDTDPEHVAPLIELSLKNSDSLKYTLAQVAAKFGALKGWKGGRGFGRDRLLEALRDTPVYEEALRETLQTELNVERTAEVLKRVRRREITIETVGERTSVGLGGRSSGQELLSPENADASVVETVKERIETDRMLLFCLHCQDWERRRQVRRIDDQPSCPTCGSTRIAALNPWADEAVRAVKSDDRDDEQERMTERAYRAASLVQGHGKKAVKALAARGVGPHNAARVINKLREDEEDFYRDILAREREYARTNAFWD